MNDTWPIGRLWHHLKPIWNTRSSLKNFVITQNTFSVFLSTISMWWHRLWITSVPLEGLKPAQILLFTFLCCKIIHERRLIHQRVQNSTRILLFPSQCENVVYERHLTHQKIASPPKTHLNHSSSIPNLWHHLWPSPHQFLFLQYVVVTVCLKAGLITNSWTWLTHCSIWGSIGLWFLFMFMYRWEPLAKNCAATERLQCFPATSGRTSVLERFSPGIITWSSRLRSSGWACCWFQSRRCFSTC